MGNSLIWETVILTLPESANDNPLVQIGFQWENDDLELGVDIRPSVAIDYVRIDDGQSPPTPNVSFSVVGGTTDFCEQTCISFMDETTFDNLSTGANFASYEWQFPGATPSISSDQNPLNICYNDPGTYSVILTVTDNIGESEPFVQEQLITVQDCGPEIIVEVDNEQLCVGEQTVTFNTDNSIGDIDNSTWFYTFISEDLLQQFQWNQQNPTVTLTQVGFYDVLISVTGTNGISELIELPNFIEVIDCFGPEVEFSVSQQAFCVGNCIQFTDQSTSSTDIIEWEWTLNGGQAEGENDFGISTQQNPLVCYDTPGNFWAVLSATDLEGPTARPDSILIVVDPCTGPPSANFIASDTIICVGDCIDFENTSLGFQEEFLWTFSGINLVSTEENPTNICYDTAGTYDVILAVSNSLDLPSAFVKADYITVEDCLDLQVSNIEENRDELIVFPNPVKDIVNFKQANRIEPILLSILDMQGRLHDSFKVISSQNSVDLSLLESGIYILVVRNIASREITDRIKIVVE
ncbi:MAG: PKD domain-containing protein [Bacteroidota bacterium]